MKNVLIDATGDKSWIGGLYYKKNIIFGLLQNEAFCRRYRLVIATQEENRPLFEEFTPQARLKIIAYKSLRAKALKLASLALREGCCCLYPYAGPLKLSAFPVKGIFWIPDFQEQHYPQFFSPDIIAQRNRIGRYVQQRRRPIVFSSLDCQHDFEAAFGEPGPSAVMHFVSYIRTQVQEASQALPEVMKEYGLTAGEYYCVCNQFWQHKNHAVVLKALRVLAQEGQAVQVVFTGEPKDHKNPAYTQEIEALFADEAIRENARVLGFLPRNCQLALMLGAKAVIQPSLFEGWGTVLEDAKVLGQRVLLSDIPVHREQMDENCTLFSPEDPQDLARVIRETETHSYTPDPAKGTAAMLQRSASYAEGFTALLDQLTGGHRE